MASVESAAPSGTNGTSASLSAADKLKMKHDDSHNPTIEEVPDEADLRHPAPPLSGSVLESPEDVEKPGWVAPPTAKSVGKRTEVAKPSIDTQSEELFPGLGGAPKPSQAAQSAPIWGAKKPGQANGSNGISTNGSSTPNSGVNTPPSSNNRAPPSLAGNIQPPRVILQKHEVLPRQQMKKPMPEILRDINKKFRTNLQVTTGENGVLRFSEGSNQKENIKEQAIKELGAQICPKTTAKVSIPRSARAHIIGKQGSTIKALQESSGARIQMPRTENVPAPIDEDDDMIDIVVEGNPMAISLAKKAIDSIASERTSSVTSKLRTVPAEFYPFLVEPADKLQQSHGVQIEVPSHYKWTSQPPPQKPSAGQSPAFLPAAGENITVTGDRASVQAARAEIEQLCQRLRQQLIVDQFSLPQGQHQFVIGNRGVAPEEFFASTQCAIIMPGDLEEENITVVGPADKVEAALNHAMELATTVSSKMIDISRQFKNTPGGGRVHARNITQYLRDRQEIEKMEKLHQTHIVTPIDSEGAQPWQLYYRDGKNSIRAQTEINSIVAAHPPSRMATVPVQEFFHKYLETQVTRQVQQDYGVRLIVPNQSQSGAPVLLVFEGESGLEPEYQVPRGQPSPQEIKAFQQGLEDARKHILELISKQEKIEEEKIDVPSIFHAKLRKFIQKEQQDRAKDQIPIRVFPSGTVITLKGPASSVETLAAKVKAFVAEAIEDEKERGFTMSFDFPQKHANQLIGKGGRNLNDIRDKYDVEINVNDGVVELKGPKAKSEAAKAHILAQGRTWADEATYVLKVDPAFHRDLIGAQGAVINRLQTKYKVQIHFPRSAKPVKDNQSVAEGSESGRKPGRPDQAPDEVIVKGPKKGADEARDEILSLLQYYKDQSFTATVTVQASQIPSLIGQGGSGMEELRRVTGARIDIPKAKDSDDPSTRIEIGIKGKKEQVAQAKKLIEEKKAVFDSTVTKTLEVDKKHHRALIGTGGSALREIVVKAGGSDDRRELAKTVQFPKQDADGNVITIQGSSSVVDKIIAAMQEIVSERESQTMETIDVPTDKHRSLIGRAGETKKDIESKFKVSIDIPRQGSEQTAIKISGLPANVEKAKTHILDLVKDQEGETIQVPRKLHHSIADNGQFFRSLRNNHKVTVDHAGQKAPPKPAAPAQTRATAPLITDPEDEDAFSFIVHDLPESDVDGDIPWILRGSPEGVAKAKANLQAAIEQALKNTTTGYLRLPDPRTYRHVIGSGGSKVNSIRKATGCKITVPRNNNDDEPIEIIGTSEGVEKAKDLILKAVKDGGNTNGNGNGNGGARWGGEATEGNGNWD